MYKEDEEERYIYFFSHRQLQKLPPADERKKVPRPVRVAKNGGWRASGPAKPLLRSPPGGGRSFVVGRMATMVFYDTVVDENGVKMSASAKTNWAINEITIPKQQRLSSVSSNTRFYDLALYRLYSLDKKAAGDTEAETSSAGTAAGQALDNVVSDDHLPAPSMAVAPCPPPAGQAFGVSTANQPPLAVGASTSAWMQPPPPQHRLSIQHAQYYYPHNQYTSFGAAAQGPGQQQLHGAMPVHHASIWPPPGHLFPLAGPPAPVPVPRSPYLMRPPAYVRPPVAQLPPAPTGTHGGAGKQVGHFGAVTHPSYLMPPAGVRPPVEQLPPATTRTHGGARQEAGHQFGSVTCSPCSSPAAGSSGISPPAQQHTTAATATTEPPDAQENGMEVPDWLPELSDLDDDDDFRLCCTMEELMRGSVLDDNELLPLPDQLGHNS